MRDWAVWPSLGATQPTLTSRFIERAKASQAQDDEDAEEQRLRKKYQDLDEPGVWEELFG
ncbi:hypothetical protein E2562_026614 [Oryza meyeriana var. granulata]|uniref:Uncharacterized protein n=1 Tax=Oryza meyeriana var. granulata TaxID=110450 RepID=A0A6G1CS71_9ORYZ|nr:hypothetical protein E2562_026614 [Oryza meyeriana var. granulata]